jgi:hypothetical protein
METKTKWYDKIKFFKVIRDFFCEDNGNGSATRLVVISGAATVLYNVTSIIHFKGANISGGDLAGLGAFFVTTMGALAIWKVYQKGQEEKVDSTTKTAV